MDPLTDAQRWVLSIGGVLTELNGDRHDVLGGSPRLLGSSAALEVLVDEWNAPTPEALGKRLEKLFARSDDDPALAFCLGRLSTIAGFGYVAYLLDAETAFRWMLRAAIRVQQRFASFRAFGEGYALGRERRRESGAWLGKEPASPDEAREAIERLVTSPESPWVRLPFDTPLQGARPPVEPQRVLTVGRSGEVDVRTIAEALSRARPGDRIVVRAGTYRERLRISTETWDDLPTDQERAMAEARAASGGAPAPIATKRKKKSADPPRAPSVEIVGEGRVVIASDEGAVVEVDDGGLVLEGITIVNERPRPGKIVASSTAVYVVDGFLRMVGCTLRSAAGFGLECFAATQLEGCTITGCGSSGVNSQAITVMRGGEVRGCGQEGVLARDEANVLLSNVRVHGCGHVGVHAIESGTIVARGCTIERNAIAGALSNEGGALTLEHCTISGTLGPGIMVLEDSSLSASDCTVRDSKETSLHVQASREVELYRCKLLASKLGGVVFIDHSSGTLEECEVRGSGLACVQLADASSPTFSDCTLGGAKKGGGVYALSGAGGRFERCTIEATSFATVELDEGANTSFVDCTIRGGKVDGVFAHGKSRGCFLRCTIRDAGGPGVRISEGADPYFERSRIEGSKEANVAVQKAGRGIFVDCALERAGLSGLEITAKCAPIVRGGSITDSGEAGVFVPGGVADVEGCDLARNDIGVRFDGGSGRIVGCTIHHSKIAGVFVNEGASPRLEACDIFENDSAGIEIEGQKTAPYVTHCHVHDNEHSIHAYGGARGTIESGEIGGGRGYALYVEEGARPSLSGVHIRPGKLGAIFDEDKRAVLTECLVGAVSHFRVPWTPSFDVSPCALAVGRDRDGHGFYSLSFTDRSFHRIGALEAALTARGIECNGYGLELLINSLLAREGAELEKALTFDCEAGTFSVRSARRDALALVAALLRSAIADPVRACAAIPEGATT